VSALGLVDLREPAQRVDDVLAVTVAEPGRHRHRSCKLLEGFGGRLMPGDDDRLRSAIDVALRGNVRGVCAEPTDGTAI